MAMNGGSNVIKVSYIPDDIIADILLKLPSKSVLRFKKACKIWYTLISDPAFINLHSKRAPQSPKILYSTSSSELFQLLDYESSSFDDCCLSGTINFPEEIDRYTTIVGSSCGLVCLATSYCGNSFSIWNPLTREYRKIPNLGTKSCRCYFHGLGYDSIHNDFKLVISMDRIRYNIFSLKANAWKTITCPIPFEDYDPDASTDPIPYWNTLAVVLNGIFHWLVVPANTGNNDLKIEIVAFDVGKETFKKLQLPPKNFGSLLEHKGCLCISFTNFRPLDDKEIWMMKEYGGNWIHLLTIKNSPIFCYELPVLCISTRSEVVFHTDEKFSRCGREQEDKWDKLEEDIYKYTCLYRPVLYAETLISPYTAEDGLQHKMKERKKLRDRYILFGYLLISSFVYLCFKISL